ncbi:MAG: hypothetical protein IIU52_06015, partial [Bacteroidaceae bacterium]|nr:hypothetical protein [Bacteroidaceae bacterium]
MRLKTFIILFITTSLMLLAGSIRPANLAYYHTPEDSLALEPDSVLLNDSLRKAMALSNMKGYTIYADSADFVKDTAKVDTTPQSKNSLDAPVVYTASDSITFDMFDSRANLYGSSQ